MGLTKFLDDAQYWHTHNTYDYEETAIRFKHRLVNIHCFANGNGRHSRLMADIIIEKMYHQPLFTWGAADLTQQGNPREKYITALQLADEGDFSELLKFSRS